MPVLLSLEDDMTTTGPWTAHYEPPSVYGDLTDKGGYRIDAPGVSQLAFVWVQNRRMPADGSPQSKGDLFGSEADARLIIAAHPLKVALKELVDAVADTQAGGEPNIYADELTRLVRQAREALAQMEKK